jgi:ribokinase
MPSPHLAVVGSLVTDLVVWLDHFPRKGETQLASRFAIFAGGKGFNQAVTAQRCGAQVSLIGRVGDDPFGQMFFDIAAREGMDMRGVKRDPIGTSLAVPMIDPHGDNSIIGVPRANTRLPPGDVEAAALALAGVQALLLQLEVPLETCRRAVRRARLEGASVVWNPAPAHLPMDEFLPREEAGLIDWLTPNEIEAETLTGVPVRDVASARTAAHQLLERGLRQGVIVTLGAQGAFALTRDGQELHVPAFPVTPVDPTGAGDAFNGAFAVALAEGQPLEQALRFANAAGALSVTVAGAEPSLPHRADVERMLNA